MSDYQVENIRQLYLDGEITYDQYKDELRRYYLRRYNQPKLKFYLKMIENM